MSLDAIIDANRDPEPIERVCPSCDGTGGHQRPREGSGAIRACCATCFGSGRLKSSPPSRE